MIYCGGQRGEDRVSERERESGGGGALGARSLEVYRVCWSMVQTTKRQLEWNGLIII